MKQKTLKLAALVLLLSLFTVGCSTQKQSDKSGKQAETVNIDFKNSSVESIITFGIYKEKPIEWILLNKQFDKALLITKESVEQDAFHTDESYPTWENSTIRTWLNEDFYNSAFNDAERGIIRKSQNTSITNLRKMVVKREYETITTSENVFLLSYDEALTYRPYLPVDQYGFSWIRDTSILGTCAIDCSENENGKTIYLFDEMKAKEKNNIHPAIWVDVK